MKVVEGTIMGKNFEDVSKLFNKIREFKGKLSKPLEKEYQGYLKNVLLSLTTSLEKPELSLP